MIRRAKVLCSFLVLLTGIFFIQGCSSDSGEAEGTFTITITGDEKREFSGTAVFGGATDPETGEQGFALIMTTAEDPENAQSASESAWLVKLNTERPGTGSYSVVDSETEENLETGFWGFSILGGEQSQVIYFSKSGSVEITKSSGDNVSGNFTIQAKGIGFTGQETQEYEITMNGEFSAIGGNAFIPNYGG